MDKKIDFFVIAAQKSGTTTLCDWFAQLPEVYFPAIKENQFFTRDEFYKQGEEYLSAYYPPLLSESVLGLADPNMMLFPESVERIRQYNPQAKCVALLRNPIDRAYSAFWMAKSFGIESCDTFEEAIEQDAIRCSGTYRDKGICYLSHGYYAQLLAPWVEGFGSKNVHICLLEDMMCNPQQFMKEVLDFLGVDANIGLIDFNSQKNPAFIVKNKRLVSELLNSDADYRRMLRKIISPRIRKVIAERVTLPWLLSNMVPKAYPPMRPETRSKLVEHFEPHNAKLGSMICKDLRYWDE